MGGLFGIIKQAFGYISSGVEKALGAVETVGQVIRGGIEIPEEKGISIYETVTGYQETWAQLLDIPKEYKVREAFASPSPFDWRQKHIMQMKIQYTDLQTGEMGEGWITVESDTELSMAEWETLADNAVAASPLGYFWDIDYIDEYRYYTKVPEEAWL